MNRRDVTERLGDVENFDSGIGMAPASHDSQTAHRKLDALYVDVLRAIADGSDDAQFLAAKVLEGENIEFSRWYA